MDQTFRKLFLIHCLVLLGSCLLIASLLNLPASSYPTLAVLATLSALLLSLIVANYFLKPIQKLQRVTEKMSQWELQNKAVEMMQDKNELSTILASMVEGVIVIDKDEKVALFNTPIYEMLDLRSAETLGKPYWEVIRNGEINALIKEAMIQRKSLKKEIDIIAPVEAQFLMQVSAIVTQNGQLSGIVAVFHDITELKKLERLRSEFVANVSHELKTPLTLIKGFAETLGDGAINDAEKAKKFLGIIQKHAQHLENLVDDLLSLSAIESKEVIFNFEKTEIEPLLQTTVSLYKEQIRQRQQLIFINVAPNLPVIFVDQFRLGQVFANLLNNAIKFTPTGGTIRINAYKDGEFVRIEFKDSGIGIEPQHIERIFERFYRVDKGRSRELGGTGLGLAIVKHIVQSHNGKVTVESELEKGSTFSVFLPLPA